eukprot:scaffold1184_cov132-Cylindrotheca_fusiformis.AAC.6
MGNDMLPTRGKRMEDPTSRIIHVNSPWAKTRCRRASVRQPIYSIGRRTERSVGCDYRKHEYTVQYLICNIV